MPGGEFVLGTLLKSIFGRRSPTTGAAAPSSSEGARPLRRRVAAHAPATDDAAGDPPPAVRSVASKALDQKLWTRVEEAAAYLGDLWKEEERSEDAEELLYLIVQSHRTLIQQPPAAAQAVMTLLGRRNYGQSELIRQIERDPAMSQALLRHANSAWYASKHGEPVISIKGAVQRIGSTGVHATVMSQVVRGQLSRPGAVFDRMVSMAWDHMVGTGPICRTLARSFGVDPEGSFTVGLLHDVGKLVFFSEVASLRKRRRRDVRLSPHFVRVALERLHEPLGGIAALQWGMDPQSAWVIAHHHRRPVPEKPDPVTELVYLAERTDLAVRTGRPLELDEVWETGGLTPDPGSVRGELEKLGAFSGPAEELAEAV